MSASCIYGTILSYYLSGTTFSEIFSIGIDEDAIQAASRQWEAKITEVYVRICSLEESLAQERFKLVYHPFLLIHSSLKLAPTRRVFLCGPVFTSEQTFNGSAATNIIDGA